MKITIDLPPETEAQLRAQAVRQGAKLEDYLGELAKQWASAEPLRPEQKTPQQRLADFTAWVDSHAHITAVADDSRESIYAGCGE